MVFRAVHSTNRHHLLQGASRSYKAIIFLNDCKRNALRILNRKGKVTKEDLFLPFSITMTPFNIYLCIKLSALGTISTLFENRICLTILKMTQSAPDHFPGWIGSMVKPWHYRFAYGYAACSLAGLINWNPNFTIYPVLDHFILRSMPKNVTQEPIKTLQLKPESSEVM